MEVRCDASAPGRRVSVLRQLVVAAGAGEEKECLVLCKCCTGLASS